jgi:translation initiation factor IF-2
MSAPNHAEPLIEEKPPVVVVMGHIDHGKSTLLDFIRRSNIVAGEAGGITQHLNAYEVTRPSKGGDRRITFLDTPGHEAFTCLRSRGASVADVAILVVSAEDGVMPQTKEAHKSILESKLPYVVAINKMDSPRATPEKTIQSLAEHDILVEEWGGPIPCAKISAKTGQGVDDLLDLVLLVAELEQRTGDRAKLATGVVIEAHRDESRGIAATLLIQDGTVKKGHFVAVAGSLAPVRLMEDFARRAVDEATFSSPVNVIGWSDMPEVGAVFSTFLTKKEAEVEAAKKPIAPKRAESTVAEGDIIVVPIIIKVGVSGTAEAIEHEIRKIETDRLRFSIVDSNAGSITEADMKRAASKPGTILVGFGTSLDPLASSIRDRMNIPVKTFTIIYQLVDWLKEIRDERTPLMKVEDELGILRVARVFNPVKGKQVVGCRVPEGVVSVGDKVKIVRGEETVGRGEVTGMQKNKSDAQSVHKGDECGAMIQSKTDISEGDSLIAYKVVER